MKRLLAVASVLLLVPLGASASTLQTGRTIVLSEASTTNAYLAGTDVTVAAAQGGDLLAAGATVAVNAPVAGDTTLIGGTVTIEKPVGGDLRAVGARVTVTAPVAGDLVVAGGTVTASSSASDTRIAGGSVSLTGANGPVIIYGSDVTLSGTFKTDVTVVASDHIVIADGTQIHGVLRYNAPQEIAVPATAHVDGGTSYVGRSTFLPTTQEAHTFAIAGATILFIVHLLAVLILTGIVAGLFPHFTERVVERSLAEHSPRRFVLLALLGFAIIVATPVLVLILLFSFVGIGVALMLAALYALFLMLAYVYAGVLAGAALARGIFKRYVISWREAVLGMLVLYLIGVIPLFGALVTFILMIAAGGAIASLAYTYGFRRNQEELPLE